MNNNTILVFGATGYVGRYLCTYLKSKGDHVIAFGRNPKAMAFLQEHGVDTVDFDILNDADYAKIPTTGVKGIINLAVCLPEHEVPMNAFFDINMTGNYKLLEFARQNGIKRFVMASTHKVYYDIYKPIITEDDAPCFIGPHSPYIISKIAAENFMQYYSKDFGMDCIVLRLTGVHGYGALMGFLKKDGSYTRSATELFMEKAVKGEPIEVWGDMSIKRDHVYIKDVIRAFRYAVNAPEGTKGIFNVSSGVAHNQYEDAVAIAKVFAGENGQSTVTLHPEKPGLTRGYCYSIEKIRKAMNWTPKYSDLEVLYTDYKSEWMKKEFHNYHHIKESDKPLCF